MMLEDSNKSTSEIALCEQVSQAETNAQKASWPQQLRRGIVTLSQLQNRGWLAENQSGAALEKAQEALDIRVPVSFHDGIERGDSSLAKQVIPSAEEAFIAPEELADPIGDEAFSPCPGLTHRYRDRALVKITYQCAMYCRFCFRRHKVSHAEENLSIDALQDAYNYIKNHDEIKEVIFTGGDPLVLTDSRLEAHLKRVEAISHIETIRFHTRIPTALPERITAELCERFSNSRKTLWVVVHINCASELSAPTLDALSKLRRAGVGLASQSVLLRGVNDSQEALENLFRGLYRAGVVPYYLHYPDLAKGTNHFRIPLETALQLVSSLDGQLPGLALPKLTIDIPGGFGKISISNENFRLLTGTSWEFRSPLTKQWQKVEYPQ